MPNSPLTLYVKTGCQYCAKVLATDEELNLTFDLKNVADEGVADELIARGGKRQTRIWWTKRETLKCMSLTRSSSIFINALGTKSNTRSYGNPL